MKPRKKITPSPLAALAVGIFSAANLPADQTPSYHNMRPDRAMKPIRKKFSLLAIAFAATVFPGAGEAEAQTTPAIPAAITTPDKVETRIGTLEYKDGAPTSKQPRGCATLWTSPAP